MLLCLALSLLCFSSHGVAVRLLSDTLLSFLVTLSVAITVGWFQRPSVGRALAIGAVLGAAIMVKPVAQWAWLPIVAAMLLKAACDVPWRWRLAHAACVVLAAGLVVGPWVVRNEVCFGSPFVTKFAGRSLWWSCFRGDPASRFNAPIPFAEHGRATLAVRQAVPGVDLHNTWKTYKELLVHGYSQIAADEVMLCSAKEAIQENPGKYALSRFFRAVWFWITPNGTWRPRTADFDVRGSLAEQDSPDVLPQADEYAGQSVWKSDWYFTQGRLNVIWRPHPLLYAAAAVATLVGLIFLIRLPECRAVAIFLALWLGYFFAVTVMVASPEYRYRMILEPTMIMIVVTACQRFRSGSCAACGDAVPQSQVPTPAPPPDR